MPAAAKLVTGVAVVLLTIGTYWFVFYSDVATKIGGAERQKKKLHDDLAQAQQAQATYVADRGDLSLHEQRARELNKVLPSDAQEDGFLSSVQQASNAAGIDLKSYSPQPEVAQTFYAKIPMRLEMTGKYHQIAKFAFELGKMDRVINVDSIELSDPKVVGDDILLHGRCIATAFHAIKPAEATRSTTGAHAAMPSPAGGGKP
jgi:type IV pilus assembly protein PilO